MKVEIQLTTDQAIAIVVKSLKEDIQMVEFLSPPEEDCIVNTLRYYMGDRQFEKWYKKQEKKNADK